MKKALKIGFGLLLIFLLVWQVEFDELLTALQTVQPSYVFYGLFFFVISTLFEIGKLHALLYPICGIGTTIRIVFIGLFFNNFLPSNVGGDAYKVYFLMKKEAQNAGTAITLTFLNRIAGLFILVGAGTLYAMIYFPELMARFQEQVLFFETSVTSGMIISFLLLIFLCLLAFIFIYKKIEGFRQKIQSFVKQSRDAISEVSSGQMSLLIFFSFMYHLFRLIGIFCFLLSFQATLEWSALILVLAIIAIVSMLPVSIGALGVREGAFTVMLAFFGVPTVIGLSVALLNRVVLWLKALVGGIFFLQRKKQEQES